MEPIGLISVIMPAYNAERTIAESVRSVIAQTYENWELIVVNDASEDDTESIIREFERQDHRIKSIKNAKNAGVSETRHRGVEQAEGKWIAFLDSDDIWLEDKLEKQISLQRKTDAKLLFTGSGFMSADRKRMGWVLHVPEEIGYKKLLKQNLLSNSSVLVQKELFLQNEMIGEGMHEDFACWLNVLKNGCVAYGVDEPLLIYRLSPDSKSGNKIKAAKMNWNTYRAVGLNYVSSVYYMAWYMGNGIMKYRKLKK